MTLRLVAVAPSTLEKSCSRNRRSCQSTAAAHNLSFNSNNMTSTQLNLIAPLDTPLPPPAEGQVLTDSQWTTLMAIADTIVPSIEVSSALSKHKLCIQASEYASAIENIKSGKRPEVEANVSQEYLYESASSIPGFKELLQRTLGDYLREDSRKGIRVVLSALE